MSTPIKFVNLNQHQKTLISEADAVVLRDNDQFYQVTWTKFQEAMVGDIRARLNNIETSITLGAGPSLWPRQQPLTLVGDVTGSVSFDGSGAIELTTTLDPSIQITQAQVTGLEDQLTQIRESIPNLEDVKSHKFVVLPELSTYSEYAIIPKDVTISSNVTSEQIAGWETSKILTLNYGNNEVVQWLVKDDKVGFRLYAGGWTAPVELMLKQEVDLSGFIQKTNPEVESAFKAPQYTLKAYNNEIPFGVLYSAGEDNVEIKIGGYNVPNLNKVEIGAKGKTLAISDAGATLNGRKLLSEDDFDPDTKLDANAVAEKAKRLETPMTMTFTGAVEGSTSFDGSSGVEVALTIRDQSIPKSKINGLAAELEDFAPKNGVGASGEWGIDISGNAATATRLKDAVTFTLTGAITGAAEWTGSNLEIQTSAGSNLNVGAEVTQKVEQLEQSVQQHGSTIGQHTQKLSTIEQQQTTLSSGLETLNNLNASQRLESLETKSAKIDEHETEIESLQGTVGTLGSSVTEATSKAESAKQTATGLQGTVQQLQTSLNDGSYVKIVNDKVSLTKPIESTSHITLSGASHISVGYSSGVNNGISCSGGFATNGDAGWSNTVYAVGVKPHSSLGVGSLNDKPFYASNFITTSDARVKRNFQEFQLNGDLHPVRYERIDTGRVELGFIAQEVHAVYPEAAVYDKDEDLWRLVPTAVMAIMSREINKLKYEVRRLKEELKSLKSS